MADLSFITIPRGRRLPQIPTTTTTTKAINNNNNNINNLKNGHFPHHTLKNGHCQGGGGGGGGGHVLHAPVVPVVNGGGGGHLVANGCTGGRAIHDGFATIRAGGGKRGRSYSSPTVTQDSSTAAPCSHGCCGPGGGRGWTMEPLWEEKGEGGTPAVSRRDRPQLPWWEVATRRSRYRSCPAFSQASVVSALEQTMNSVTSTLERLASSPDLKETEAAEIRKTAAVLRQQSSAVCQSVSSGYISLERQLSCDSVSSVTSTVSGASLSSYASLGSRSLTTTLMPHCNAHNLSQPDALNPTDQAAKLKKRSWLRSSFRRAFGRHGRKLNKQQGEVRSAGTGGSVGLVKDLPLHHTVNTAVRHLPVPPVPHHPPPPYSASLPRKSHSSGLLARKIHTQNKQSAVEGKEEELRRLREEVTEKERALTDCRLEVLSAQHQMQAQADTIARLQAELAGLREENLRLVGVVKGQKGTTGDQLLPSLTHTLTSLAITPSPISRTNSVPHENGHQMKVVVVGGHHRPSPTSPTSPASLDPTHLTHIGNITVESKTTWEHLDAMVINTLKDYGNSIDPVSALGLDASALQSYQMDEVVCGPHLPRPELLPYGYCVGDVDAVLVWLKDAGHKKDGETLGNVSAAAMASLTPASALRQLAGLLVEHRRLVLAGPPAVGKTSLAHTLAELFVVNAGHEVTEETVKVFRVTGSNSLELCQLLANTWPRGAATSSLLGSSIPSTSPSSSSSSSSCSPSSSPSSHSSQATPFVLVLDDLHVAGGVVETLKRYLPSALHSGPAIIATCCPTTALSTRLHIHCNFKWASLSPQQEPVRGLLGRVLRRRVAAAEAAANTRLPDAHHVAEWLARLWLHLNTLLAGHCGAAEATLGPGLLLDCPLGQEETQAWFLEVWNGRLVPHIVEAMRAAAPHPPSLAQAWTDPLDWVLATYPWPNSVASGPDHLTRIPVSNILTLVSSSSSSSNNSSDLLPSVLSCLTATQGKSKSSTHINSI